MGTNGNLFAAPPDKKPLTQAPRMDFTMYYCASASRDAQIERITETFGEPRYNPTVVDFPFSDRWVQNGYIHQPDYRDNWEKYGLCVVADVMKDRYGDQLPDHFRGVVMEIDEGCEPVWFAFGRYPDEVWRCDHFTNTQYASRGFQTHLAVVDLLLRLGPLVDHMRVADGSDYWHTGDAAEAARRFDASRDLVTSLGDVLGEMAPGVLAPELPGYGAFSRQVRKLRADPDA